MSFFTITTTRHLECLARLGCKCALSITRDDWCNSLHHFFLVHWGDRVYGCCSRVTQHGTKSVFRDKNTVQATVPYYNHNLSSKTNGAVSALLFTITNTLIIMTHHSYQFYVYYIQIIFVPPYKGSRNPVHCKQSWCSYLVISQ